MGLFDLFTPKKDQVKDTRTALEAAADPAPLGGDGRLDQAMSKLVTMLLDLGLDGKGPLDSATEVADEALRKSDTPEAAVHRVARGGMTRGAIGGFVTGLGGFVTMPIALPANVLEFYVQATRMVGAIATLRGYDVRDPQIRTAVLLTLVGSKSDEVLRKAGMATGGGRLATIALRNVPPTALMVINKAVGFNLMKGVGSKAFGKLGRGVPVVGGVIGGGVDGYMMKKIADHAMKEFPRKVIAPGA